MSIAGKAIVPFVGNYDALIAGADRATEGVAQRFKGLLGPVSVFGAAVAAAGAIGIDMATKYQKSTDQIAANADITIVQAEAIGTAFLATGGKVKYTAQQMEDALAPAAGQLEEIAGRALTVAENTGFMDAAMALAEATGEELGATVKTVADIMQAYHIPVADAASVTDILENVSRRTDITIDTLGTTVDRLHAKLGPLTPSLSDVATLLLDVTDHGLSGSRALLLVSTGLNTLLGGSKKTTAEIDKLHISLFNANDQFVGLQSILTQLGPKLDKMSEKQRFAAEQALFGNGASKALDATLMAGLPAWEASAKAVNKTGSAQDAAKKATSGLSGELDLLKTKVIDGATSFGESMLPEATAFTGWIINDGIPDLEKFGKWLDDNVINPFIFIAKIVIPPLLSGLGFVTSHFEILAITAAPIIAGIAGMWAIDKIGTWADAAESALKRVGAFYGIGGGPASALGSAAAVQQVYVTNWAMIGAGSSGAQYLEDDAIGGAGAGLGGGETTGLLASILSPEVMIPIAAGLLATLGIVYVATHPAPAPVTKGPANLDSATANDLSLLLGGNPQGFGEKADANANDPFLGRASAANPADRDRKAQQLSDDQFQALKFKYTAIANAAGYTLPQWIIIQESSTALAQVSKDKGAQAQVDLLLLERKWEDAGASATVAASVSGDMSAFLTKHGPLTTSELAAFQDVVGATNLHWYDAESASKTISAWMAKNGPLTVAQLQAFKDDLAGGVTSVFDINLSLQSINDKLAPAVDYADRFASAIASGLTVAQARKVAKPGHILDTGGPITEDVVGYGMETGEVWQFHKDETVIPKGRASATGAAGAGSAGAGLVYAPSYNVSGSSEAQVMAQIEDLQAKDRAEFLLEFRRRRLR